MDFQCPGRKHAVVVDDLLEVKCRSKVCGARSGVVVLHYFHVTTGKLERTEVFTDPSKFDKKEGL